jgi:hypothetical protein
LAMRFVVGVERTAITGFVFVLDVVTALRIRRESHTQRQSKHDSFHTTTPHAADATQPSLVHADTMLCKHAGVVQW